MPPKYKKLKKLKVKLKIKKPKMKIVRKVKVKKRKTPLVIKTKGRIRGDKLAKGVLKKPVPNMRSRNKTGDYERSQYRNYEETLAYEKMTPKQKIAKDRTRYRSDLVRRSSKWEEMGEKVMNKNRNTTLAGFNRDYDWHWENKILKDDRHSESTHMPYASDLKFKRKDRKESEDHHLNMKMARLDHIYKYGY